MTVAETVATVILVVPLVGFFVAKDRWADRRCRRFAGEWARREGVRLGVLRRDRLRGNDGNPLEFIRLVSPSRKRAYETTVASRSGGDPRRARLRVGGHVVGSLSRCVQMEWIVEEPRRPKRPRSPLEEHSPLQPQE